MDSTQETIREKHRADFERLDTEGKGHISRDTVMEFLRERAPPHSEGLETLVAEADADADGRLSIDDFASLCERAFEPPSTTSEFEEKLFTLFGMLDYKRDGVLTADELQKIFEKMGDRLSEAEAAEMVRYAAPDGAGVVSFEAFRRVMLRQAQ